MQFGGRLVGISLLLLRNTINISFSLINNQLISKVPTIDFTHLIQYSVDQ